MSWVHCCGVDADACVCAAGETPMTCAAYYGHTDVIKELIENGADVNLVS